MSTDISIFVEIPQVPVHCNLLWPTFDEAVAAPRADMQLGSCRFCSHIYNYGFNPDHMKYTQDYENSLHFSSRFQEHARTLALQLIERYGLRHKDVIEIGCGSGDFLTLLCELGDNRGVGFDPGHAANRAPDEGNNRITFISDFYSQDHRHYKADLICCRHVLEHIRFPRDFLLSLRRTIDGHLNTIVFFEVPNVMFTLRDLGIWDLIYEHCSYFSSRSLAYLFTVCGFQVTLQKEAFGGQFLCLDALPAEVETDPGEDERYSPGAMEDYVARFGATYAHQQEKWRHDLERMKKDRQRIVVWGAGSKGVTFLNAMQGSGQVDFVVDINPHKNGKYVAGTGQRIVPPGFLREYQPEIVIVMNPIYVEEMSRTLKEMNVSPQLISVGESKDNFHHRL